MIIELRILIHFGLVLILSLNLSLAKKRDVADSSFSNLLDLPTLVILDKTSGPPKVTGAATLIDSQQIALLQPTGTQELLEKIPGVVSAADDGFGNSRISVGLRGLNPRRSSKVLIMEDGVPIQPAPYIYANSYYNPPVERLIGLEVIKGPGGVKYGPQTMGGVINYITKRPRINLGGMGKFTIGENGYFSLYGEYGGWGNKKLHPEFQLLLKRGNGFRDNNSFNQINGTLKLNYVVNENEIYYLKLNANYERSNATYTGLTEYTFKKNPNFNPKEDDVFEVFRPAVDMAHTKYIGENLTQNTKAYGSYFWRIWWRENDSLALVSGTDLQRLGNNRDNFAIQREFYVGGIERNYEWLHKISSMKGNLDFGARVHWERFMDDFMSGTSPDDRSGLSHITVDNSGKTILLPGAKSQRYQTSSFSLYATEKIKVKNLRIEPGVRMEWFEQTQIDLLNGGRSDDLVTLVFLPGVGFGYDTGPIDIFAGVHRGFTPPSSGNIFSAGNQNDVFDVNPEKSWNYELGFRGNPWKLDFQYTFFLLDIENINSLARQANPVDLGESVAFGIEASQSLNFSEINSLLPEVGVNYTWLQTEIKDAKINVNGSLIDLKGNDLAYSPNHILTSNLTWTILNRLLFFTQLNFTSQQFSDVENIESITPSGIQGPIPWHMTFDMGFRYNKEKWSLNLTSKNLTDEVYIGSRLHSNPHRTGANQSSGILIGPRRQTNLSLSYKF